MGEDTGGRAAAGIGAVCMLFVGLYGLLAFPQRPDPAIPDGDPCCSHPDTWAEVRDGLPWFITVALAQAFVFGWWRRSCSTWPSAAGLVRDRRSRSPRPSWR